MLNFLAYLAQDLPFKFLGERRRAAEGRMLLAVVVTFKATQQGALLADREVRLDVDGIFIIVSKEG